ncbi:MAG: DNA-directed RNA polymerase subunit alpha C-terminal domain-containing protein [Acidobacteriota bacterium]
MGCKQLGDLDGLSYGAVLKKKDCGQKTISELESLISRLQSGKLQIRQANSQTPSGMETLDLPIEALGLSVRAYNSLKWRAGISTVRELIQKSETELLSYKNFGRKSLKEIKDVLAPMNLHLKIGYSQEPSIGGEWIGSLRIFIPQSARGWLLSQMPLSTRLAGVLEKKGFRLLGDLHGLSFEEARGFKNCGRRTVAELESFVHRIQSGELDVIQTCAEESIPLHLVRLIDDTVEKLPLRERGILLMRFGGAGNDPMTLEEIGAKYELTRERVRQIADRTIKQLQRAGWLLFDQSLKSFSERCLKDVCPLTPELFRDFKSRKIFRRGAVDLHERPR